MTRFFLCPIIGSGTDLDPFRSSIANIKTNGGRSALIPADDKTGIPIFNHCIVVAFGEDSLVSNLESDLAKDILKMNHLELHEKLAEGRFEAFSVRIFPESNDAKIILTNALQQQKRSATADGMGVR